MNWRYLLGSAANRIEQSMLARMPPLRGYPHGRNWLYDVRRFSDRRPIRVVFDVGANIGQTAWGLVRFFPEAAVHCVEPGLQAFAELEKSYSGFQKVRLHCVALGSQSGTAEMALHDNSEKNTLTTPDWKTDQRTHPVVVRRLDDLCSTDGIVEIDILKMDVQGWELEVLRGGGEMISDRRVRFIYSEVGFSSVEPDMIYFENLHSYLSELGYKFCGFYEQFRWGNTKQYVGFASALYSSV